MAAFDPLLRRETIIFQRTNVKNGAGTECMLLLPFKLVEYDGVPDMFLEPANMRPFEKGLYDNASPVDPVVDGTVIAGIQIVDSQFTFLGEVHEFHFC